MPSLPGALNRLVPPTPLSRRLALQSLLFATGEGTFLTVSAVFLLKVVGMTATQAGLAITLAGVLQFVVAYPTGRVVDRLGPKRMWTLSAVGRGLSFVALPFVDSFWSYVGVALVFAVFDSLGDSAHHAYVLDVLPRAERVQTQAYLYSSLNVGFTLGALLGGLALATGSTEAIRWCPWLAAVLTLLNGYWVTRLPDAPHDLRVASGEVRVKPVGPGPLRNVGWMLVTFFSGMMWTNQVLLHTVIPLWLVQETDAPEWLLAWLFGTNTVMCIFLPPYLSRMQRDLRTAMKAVWISTAFFVVSCLITMVTHSTVGLVTVLLVWLGHVTVTGAELFISGASWTFQSDLMDPTRRGEYQGVQDVFSALGSRWAPAAFTWLAMEWGGPGWLVIAVLIVGAATGLGPSVRLAARFRDQHFAEEKVPA